MEQELYDEVEVVGAEDAFPQFPACCFDLNRFDLNETPQQYVPPLPQLAAGCEYGLI